MALIVLSFGAARIDRAWAGPVILENTENWTITGDDGARYRIMLARPGGPPPPAGFPVVYILDAASAFATAVDASRAQRPIVQAAVIVGIEAEDVARRTYDFTPSTDDRALLPNRFDPPPGRVGGAERFFVFLDKTLKPDVAARVTIDPSRQVLMGHSLGGLFVLHTLFRHPDAFQSYVAGSPSIWWGDRIILSELDAFTRTPHPRQRLLVTVGGEEQKVTPAVDRFVAQGVAAADRPAVIAMNRCLIAGMAAIDNARWLAFRLSRDAPANFAVGFAIFPHEGHVSAIPAYVSRGLNFALGDQGWADGSIAIGRPRRPISDLHRCTAPYPLRRSNPR